MLRTQTVTNIDKVTSIIVNKRYFPKRGTAKEVGGMISARSRKKTVSERRMDTVRVTFSPESDGR